MDILLAEDNLVFRNILGDLLESWGHHVIQAPDGLKACEVLMGLNPPAMAILDWNMPGMTGVEICKRVRAGKDGHDIYLLLMTGSVEKERLESALKAGADDYLTKPFEPEALQAKVLMGLRTARV